MSQSHQEVFLKDYQPPRYFVLNIELKVSLEETFSEVDAIIQFVRNEKSTEDKNLILNGECMELLEVHLDGQPLALDAYVVDEHHLEIKNVPDQFQLHTKVRIQPQKNLTLEGLYKSGDIFCTQCESEGFRKITYYPDRPDVMATFTTTVIASKEKYPILLANGNLKDQGDLEDGKHYVTWEDPFLKPCYLFALVAGDLAVIEDTYQTASGKKVDLAIYVDKGNEGKCEHAMRSLKNSMKWDEDRFGLECDLDHYKIVAVNDFNFGAMENKGLNVFNSQYVLADPQSATDANYQGIEGVIGHEYFHNWTGNRVTCRDWFQITLKEGLTVFRDQEFSSDMGSRPVKRISDVRRLRDYQFVEDAGPNAHPIQPKSYIEINNFYTVTVYEKGSEIIRMIHTFLGEELFQKGMDEYFELFDGQAVTTEDFVRSMELASGKDLSQFRNWYDQAGTPICKVLGDYDAEKGEYRLTVKQETPVNQKGKDLKPFYFPLNLGFLDEQGAVLGDEENSMLTISKSEETFCFKLPTKPVPSLFRNFSAPIILDYDYSNKELATLLAHDKDSFSRFEAGQRLATRCLNQMMDAKRNGGEFAADAEVLEAFGALIRDEKEDPAFKAEALTLPSLVSLVEPMPVCDYQLAEEARDFLISELAREYELEWKKLYSSMQTPGEYQVDSLSIGKRALKNRALGYLSSLETEEALHLLVTQQKEATNMTDEIAAFALLGQTNAPAYEGAVDDFYSKWSKDVLVMNKWFAVQATSKRGDTLKQVESLLTHAAFDAKNPNKIRSLLGAFTQNFVRFHDLSGEAYEFIADQVIHIDDFNPSVASHLAAGFKKYAKMDDARKDLMYVALDRILKKEKLSPHVYEIASKILAV